ncbi:hypothetical protein PRZ48_000852 [Zasmidium cellare]|uniref:Uncharacterized protein n=1 Tax=Zasmidium cellare TaxID=395010 RepID=A0ABR0F197_ZASCE|nr:hypothetical protein PRZ48_000852 [Zasmidium cellare]
MNQPRDPIELQQLPPNGGRAAHEDDAAQAAPMPGASVAAAGQASGAASSGDSDNAQVNAPKPPNTGLSLWRRYREWWPELFGALLSILLLAAIIIFLAKIDGSKLDDWHLAWQIKPPTIVSILVTLCRITLAFYIAEGIGQLKWVFFEQRPHQLSDFDEFDEATRGPWGATCFIWKINRRAFVATFGAVMAVLVLAMDPFSQQVLYYAPRVSMITDDVATLPAADFYDSGALYAAFSIDNSTASFDPAPDPSSSSVVANGGPRTFGQPPGTGTAGSTTVTLETPGPTAFGIVRSKERAAFAAASSQGQSNCSDTLMARTAYAGLSRDLLSFTSYRFPKNDGLAYMHCRLPKAYIEQCTLFWCAKTFNSPIAVQGKMEEGPSTNMRLVPFDAANKSCPGLGTIRAPEREPGVQMQGLIREDKTCPQSSKDVGPNDAFWVNKNDHIMTVNMLVPMIYEREMAVDGNGATYDGQGSSSASDAALMTALWDNHEGNLSLTLADIATAMTNRVRLTNGYVNVDGTSTRTETVIKVTWYWLIYMVAMVGLSLTFFVTAVVFASEKSKVVWKSSSLAVLMHGLEGFDRAELDHRSIDDMSKTAKDLWAQLETDGEGSLRLVRH